MKPMNSIHKQNLRAIQAAYVALFFAACSVQAEAGYTQPFFQQGSTVTTTNASGNYMDSFFQDGSNTYTVTISPTPTTTNLLLQNTNTIVLVGNNSSITVDQNVTLNDSGPSTATLEIDGTGTVTNSGSIIESNGGGMAINIQGNGTVTNTSTGSISATEWLGVYILNNGTVTNAGSITSYDEVAIEINGSGIVTNSGMITSTLAGGIYIGDGGTVTNSGAITGGGYDGIVIYGTGTVNNSGRIVSANTTSTNPTSGYDGVQLEDGGTVTNSNDGSIVGYTNGVEIDSNGTVANIDGSIGSYTGNGIDITGAGTVTNGDGEILGGDITSTNVTTGKDGVLLGSGSVTNSSDGLIGGYVNGAEIDGTGTVTNAGEIQGYTKNGVEITGYGTVANTGIILGANVLFNNPTAGHDGVLLEDGGTVTNSSAGEDLSGYIIGYANGVEIDGAGSVINSALIAGYTNGIVITGGGTVNNSSTGEIESLTGDAIDITGTGMIINAGEIESESNNAIVGNGNETVVNSGEIIATSNSSESIQIAGNGYITNTGSGEMVSSLGLYTSSNGTLSNSGTIVAFDGYGVNFGGSAVVTMAGGLISAFDNALYVNGTGGAASTVTVLGRTSLTGALTSNLVTSTLDLNLVGLTPTEAAGLQEEVLLANSTTKDGTYTIGTNTYTWNNFNVTDNAISLEQVVDPGLINVAKAIDDNPLPAYNGPGSPGAQFDLFYVAAAGNPEAALNELVGREINQGIDTLGVNIGTTLASDLNSHLDNLLTGNQLGGIDVGGLHVSDAGSMIAFSDTSSQLDSLLHMTGGLALRGTEMSTDSKAIAAVAPPPSWGVWASGNVTLGNESGTSSLSGFHSTLGSPTLGVDYRVTPNLVLGILGSYTTGGANFDDGSKIGLNAELAALYGTWRDGNWHVNGIGGGGSLQLNDTRTTFGGDTASSTPRGDDFLTDWTGGYDFHLGDRWNITPEVGLQYTHLDIDSFTETGAGALNLSEGDQDIDSLRSHVGFNLNKAYSLGKDLTFIPELRAQWYHEFMDNSRGISESLPGAPATGSFDVGTYAPQRDFALVGVGLNTAFTGYNGVPVGLFINYNAQVGQSDYIANSVNAGIRVDF